MEKEGKFQHVVPYDEGSWAVKIEGGKKITKIFQSKENAIRFAQELAAKHNVCLVAHEQSGRFDYYNCKPKSIKKNKHVIKREGVWGVITAGGKKLDKVFNNKKSAVIYAHNKAYDEGVCMLVHDRNGKIIKNKCPKNQIPTIIEVYKARKRNSKKLSFIKWLLIGEKKIDRIEVVK